MSCKAAVIVSLFFLGSAASALAETVADSCSVTVGSGGLSHSPGLDLKVGYQVQGSGLVDSFGIEGNYLDKAAPGRKESMFSMEVVVPMSNHLPVVPFLAVGPGTVTGSIEPGFALTLGVGGGVKYSLSERLQLRGDLRETLVAGGRHDLDYTIGLSWIFARTKYQVAERAVPPVSGRIQGEESTADDAAAAKENKPARKKWEIITPAGRENGQKTAPVGGKDAGAAPLAGSAPDKKDIITDGGTVSAAAKPNAAATATSGASPNSEDVENGSAASGKEIKAAEVESTDISRALTAPNPSEQQQIEVPSETAGNQAGQSAGPSSGDAAPPAEAAGKRTKKTAPLQAPPGPAEPGDFGALAESGTPAPLLAYSEEPVPARCDALRSEVRHGEPLRFVTVNFAPGNGALSLAARRQVEAIARYMLANPGTRAAIYGHTDDSGDFSDNIDLSRRRAASVKEYLVKLGVAGKRSVVRGYGSCAPVAGKGTGADRNRNRRATVLVF